MSQNELDIRRELPHLSVNIFNNGIQDTQMRNSWNYSLSDDHFFEFSMNNFSLEDEIMIFLNNHNKQHLSFINRIMFFLKNEPQIHSSPCKDVVENFKLSVERFSFLNDLLHLITKTNKPFLVSFSAHLYRIERSFNAYDFKADAPSDLLKFFN